jgi:hypothetical protein
MQEDTSAGWNAAREWITPLTWVTQPACTAFSRRLLLVHSGCRLPARLGCSLLPEQYK